MTPSSLLAGASSRSPGIPDLLPAAFDVRHVFS